MPESLTARWVAVLGVLIALSGCATTGERPGSGGSGARDLPMVRLDADPEDYIRESSGRYVVVDLDENRLRMMDGETVLWSALVGTGTGLRLRGDDGEWHFSTPQGVFQVQYKEELPVWYLPDWYFVEKGLPVPPDGAPERRVPQGLGVAAVYLGEEIAIHGTDKPWLLGKRVSHGCIRLSNADAIRLFHNVQVGTPIVIVGGRDLAEVPLDAAAAAVDEERTPVPYRDTLGVYSTEDLLARLDRQLRSADATALWTLTASRLITRGLKDDAVALRGLLERAGASEHELVTREYAAFLADTFARGALRTVVSLARIDPEARARAAAAIVRATAELAASTEGGSQIPWPTRRVPPTRLGPDGRIGWEALYVAEQEHRESRLAFEDEESR